MKKKIAMFQNDLGVGGIQRSLINLLTNLDFDRFEVDLFLSEQHGWSERVPDGLTIRYLPPIPRVYSFLPFDVARRRARITIPSQTVYDLAVDFNSYQCTCALGATTVAAKKRVMWIHNDVEIKLREEWKYRVLWHFFKGKFKYYDGFVPVSQALIEPFQRASGIMGKPFTAIPNYIDVPALRRKAAQEPQGLTLDESCLNLCALGRLCHQKGYDLMLDSFAAASAQRDDLRLYIIGDGPDRAKLEQQCARLGLGETVFFLGNQENPFCYMKHMDGLVSTSRYEGQGMNIMEARAVGLPVYCTKNLEAYIEDLAGYADLVSVLVNAQKQPLRPDDLIDYNRAILERFASLTE